MRRLALLVLFAIPCAVRGELVENVKASNDSSQTYTLYLPSSYDAAKKYPVLLILDPRGRGTPAAERFREAAEEQGWILISSNGSRSDEDGDHNERALRALWPEIARYSADPKRIYATGFSGTAMVSWGLGIKTGKLAGVIGVGGRLLEEVAPRKFSFAHFGFAGDYDFNNREMRAVDEALEREGKTHRFQSFEGVHQWMSPALAREALAWMEIVAMRDGLRPRDAAMIAKVYAAEIAASSALERSQRKLDALRRYRAAVRTFDGLLTTDEARAAIARLERDPAVTRAIADEEKWDEYEKKYLTETFGRISQLLNGDASRLMQNFRVGELQKHATRGGAEGAAARRLLSSVYGQMNFYLPRALEARGEHDRAAVLKTVAARIGDFLQTLK